MISRSWIRLLWMRVLGLRVDSAAVDGAAALLALHYPGLGKCAGEPDHGDSIGEEKENMLHFVKLRFRCVEDTG